MKISTKGIYAIEAMVDLAIHSQENVESIKNIAERRHLSEKYLEQIIGALRRADLIISTRGATGGYQLAKAADKITALEILQATENHLVPVECIEKETDCEIDCNKCSTRGLWRNLWNEIQSVIENVTVADLVEETKVNELIQETNVEYFI